MRYQNFVLTFQAKTPQPLVYARALLQSYIFRDNILLGSMSIRSLIDDDLSLIVLPNSPLLDPANDAAEVAFHSPRFALAHQMETFRQRAAAPLLEIYRSWSQNRCRTRRSLFHLLRAWENLQADAEETDQLLQLQLEEKPLQPDGSNESVFHLPLSSWAYFHKLRIMEWVVQLGFELSVYQPNELAGMYWYLSYLAGRRVQHLERIKAFTIRDHKAFVPKGNRSSQIKAASFDRSFEFLQIMELDAAATMELAESLSGLYAVLERLDLIPSSTSPATAAVLPSDPSRTAKTPDTKNAASSAEPASTFSSSALRYDVRMRPFAAAGLPELPPHEAFVEAVTRPKQSTLKILERSTLAATTARREFEMLSRLGEVDGSTAYTEDGDGLGGSGGWGAFAGPPGTAAHARWLLGAKNCLRSTIAAGLAISGVKKGVEAVAEGEKVRIKIEVPLPEKGYHVWWIVPKVTAAS